MINFENFKNAKDAVFALSNALQTLVAMRESRFFNLALSGGGTAKIMFEIWRDFFSKKIDWSSVRFFWVDERMVEDSSNESNFGEAYRNFFEPLKIPNSQIFKIDGTLPPEDEAARYEREVFNVLEDAGKKYCADTPQFDCVILGLGTDGHTASIFSGDKEALTTKRMFVPARHPESGQMRLTMSANAVLNSHEIFMLVLGDAKKEALRRLFSDIAKKSPESPASFIVKNAADISIFTDFV